MSSNDRSRFGTVMLQHLDAAYNLARWLTRNDHAAEDVVQEAYCRALKYQRSFRGGPGRPWLLRVVRRTAYDWAAKSRRSGETQVFDETIHGQSHEQSAEQLFFKQVDVAELYSAIDRLPDSFREVTVLRDLEGLSYQEIAEVIEAPIGTVMSRLSRGRKQLQQLLVAQAPRED